MIIFLIIQVHIIKFLTVKDKPQLTYLLALLQFRIWQYLIRVSRCHCKTNKNQLYSLWFPCKTSDAMMYLWGLPVVPQGLPVMADKSASPKCSNITSIYKLVRVIIKMLLFFCFKTRNFIVILIIKHYFKEAFQIKADTLRHHNLSVYKSCTFIALHTTCNLY